MSSRLIKKSLLLIAIMLLGAAFDSSDPVLNGLIAAALQNNPDIKASLARIEAGRHRIPQAGNLPDPQVTFGYQNEGFDRYSYGQEQGSQWMFSASQQFLFPGKRGLKEDMAKLDVQGMEAMHEVLKLKTAARVKELYFDLFLAHKNIELLQDKRIIFARIEDMTLARYASGKALQQEVLMAQTEKYMLLEKEEMLRQKIQSLEAMLNAAIGKDISEGSAEPAEPVYQSFPITRDEAVKRAIDNSPEIKYRSKMIETAETRHEMAKKEYYPDFSINAGYYNRSGDFKDMWSATATVNIPLYFTSKQQPAVQEAKAGINQSQHELKATKLMITAAVKDNYSMVQSTEKLMDIYKNGLIPKNRQDVEQALSGYNTGKTEAIVVISRSKNLLDYELLYWSQFVEREKAIARLQAITENYEAKAGGENK